MVECARRDAEVDAPGGDQGDAGDLHAEDGEHARVAAKAFAIDNGAKFPKGVAKIIDDLAVLLAFYDYPAEH